MKEILRNINQIIERDSKDTTYKFALLRATIDAIQEQSPWIKLRDNEVKIPLGLLVLKWLEYYYQIIKHGLPQKNGDNFSTNTIRFRKNYLEIIEHYEQLESGGYELLQHDLMSGDFPQDFGEKMYQLCKEIRNTIKEQPMKYIGKSVYGAEYHLFKRVKPKKRLSKPGSFNATFLIERFGYCSIPRPYYEVFEYMGSFITGTNSIIISWAQFTADKSNRNITLTKVLPKIIWSTETQRNVQLAKKIYKNYYDQNEELYCVWSGTKIKNDLNIDHVLPFSVMKNNDLWNLLPTKESVNSRKRDHIPSPKLLEQRKPFIMSYWNAIKNYDTAIFNREISINLVPDISSTRLINLDDVFKALVSKSQYLIDQRGYESYEGP